MRFSKRFFIVILFVFAGHGSAAPRDSLLMEVAYKMRETPRRLEDYGDHRYDFYRANLRDLARSHRIEEGQVLAAFLQTDLYSTSLKSTLARLIQDLVLTPEGVLSEPLVESIFALQANHVSEESVLPHLQASAQALRESREELLNVVKQALQLQPEKIGTTEMIAILSRSEFGAAWLLDNFEFDEETTRYFKRVAELQKEMADSKAEIDALHANAIIGEIAALRNKTNKSSEDHIAISKYWSDGPRINLRWKAVWARNEKEIFALGSLHLRNAPGSVKPKRICSGI